MTISIHKKKFLICAIFTTGVQMASAGTVSLQNATATFSQDANFSIGAAIDGVIDGMGWAIYPAISSQTAVFETASNQGTAGGSELTFVISQVLGNFHTIGGFKLSITTDDRSTFADGLSSGGSVSANWTTLVPSSFAATSGATFAQRNDGATIVSGASFETDTYTITAITNLVGITGIRFDVLTDSSLPAGGPGRASNGNFVLSEFQASISAVPEPANYMLMAFGLLSLAAYRRNYSMPR